MFEEILIRDFKNKKYLRWYIDIVSGKCARNKKDRYYEAHHILPSCLYPEYKNLTQNRWNKVLLTPKEHFICHWLLTKICNDDFQYHKMLKAFSGMSRSRDGKRKFSSFEYSKLRENASLSMSLMRKGKPSWNSGKKCVQKAWNKGLSYKSGPRKEGTGKNISEGKKKTPKIECVYCNKYFDSGNHKKYHGEKCRKNPNIDPLILIERSELAKANIEKQKQNGTFQSTQERMKKKGLNPHAHNDLYHKCPFCGKEGKGPTMKRHHFDNCKFKNSSD